MELYEDFPNNLKKYRKEAKLSQAKLGELLNVSQNAVYNWENGKREPDMRTLLSICEILNVTPAQLLGYVLETKPIKNRLADIIENTIELKTNDIGLEKMVYIYTKLNEDGKKKAIERIEELADAPRHRKPFEDGGSYEPWAIKKYNLEEIFSIYPLDGEEI